MDRFRHLAIAASTAWILFAAWAYPAAAKTVIEFNGHVEIWCSIGGMAPAYPIEVTADPRPVQIGQLWAKSNGAPVLSIPQVIAIDADGARQVLTADAISFGTAGRQSVLRQGSAQMRLNRRSERFTITVLSAQLAKGTYRFKINAQCSA